MRRASAGLSPLRAGALLALILAAAAIYGVGNSSAFGFREVQLEGASVTSAAAVEEVLDLTRGTNLFQLATRDLEAAVADLPTVAAAQVSVGLPDTVVVRLEERDPVLVWRVGARRYLADADGHLFAKVDETSPPGVAALPVVEDQRAASAGLAVGSTLQAIDLDAATRLASLVPGDVGSEGERLDVIVTDPSGFSVYGRPAGWRAIFGFYTASLRTPDLIPGQVRLLRSLLIGREPLIERVILASETDGTYIPRPTPKPTATPKPTPTPAP
ncbi:MAG TPA: FtsQ-type POTRA domain-containing protein [Candidatus Saccharimonadales bacterium]|nr:FtsQ-type POTRA domain-containing protein [Candidatus Saccharimonadales bacterium]